MVRRVTQLRVNYSTTGCPIPTSLGSIIYSFLAPALKEALHRTDFAGVTRIVPGEADDWCASHAKDHRRSIIFTGDTDLFLYDYPSETLLMLFKDVEISLIPELKVFSPTGISQQLELRSLVNLAYAIQTDRWKSFAENVRQARNHNSESADFLEFSRRYIDKVESPWRLLNHPELNAPLQALDVRVSEFVQQALSIKNGAMKDAPLSLSVFLPLLFEDPFQTSAWTSGAHLRLLAYSLLTPSHLIVQEHKRKAQSVSIQELSLYTEEQKLSTASELSRTLSDFAWDEQLVQAQRWILLAVQLAITRMKAPHVSLLARVINGNFDNTWGFVQLSASIQAVLYSLRMLKQCIAVWFALNSVEQSGTPLYELLISLRDGLETFPTIPDLFMVPGQSSRLFLDNYNLGEAIKEIYTTVGIEDKELFEEPKSKRQKKREKRDRKARTQLLQETPQSLSSNAFAVLGQDS